MIPPAQSERLVEELCEALEGMLDAFRSYVSTQDDVPAITTAEAVLRKARAEQVQL